jgi:hypothetical protein
VIIVRCLNTFSNIFAYSRYISHFFYKILPKICSGHDLRRDLRQDQGDGWRTHERNPGESRPNLYITYTYIYLHNLYIYLPTYINTWALPRNTYTHLCWSFKDFSEIYLNVCGKYIPTHVIWNGINVIVRTCVSGSLTDWLSVCEAKKNSARI